MSGRRLNYLLSATLIFTTVFHLLIDRQNHNIIQSYRDDVITCEKRFNEAIDGWQRCTQLRTLCRDH